MTEKTRIACLLMTWGMFSCPDLPLASGCFLHQRLEQHAAGMYFCRPSI